ncbi:hypothetical protein, partial [Enterobacter hormaechei]
NSASSAILAQGVASAALVYLLHYAPPVVFCVTNRPGASTRKTSPKRQSLIKKKDPTTPSIK